ncbi:hypothetical protein NM688_g7507 [Phlebia brevispora]|uniref:Uncharacterized protein n=1 Tax=Phlebia brevispora TaxID=194682 RepID=A0ACC1S4G1_9APHY|nr:hypothetical protein NM688_g7507 [Phlebia brevispora]
MSYDAAIDLVKRKCVYIKPDSGFVRQVPPRPVPTRACTHTQLRPASQVPPGVGEAVASASWRTPDDAPCADAFVVVLYTPLS